MTNEQFITLVGNAVVYENTIRKFPLFSSVVIAQAILESGFRKI